MQYSTLVGRVSNEREIYDKSDETLYLSKLSIRGREFPLVGYDTAFQDCEGGKVVVRGYVKSDKRGGSLFTYIKAITMENCFEEREETSEMTVSGVLAKKFKLDAGYDCQEVQRFIIRYRDADKSQNLVHCVARGKLARTISKVEIGSTISVRGVLLSKEKTLELFVREFYEGVIL